MATANSAAPQQSGGWLFGRSIDLIIGCGVGYVLTLPLLVYLGRSTGASQWPWFLVAIFGLLVNAPHYGATIVRVYEEREDRQKYAFFAVYVTIALAILFAISSRSLWMASLLITAYVTWSPWHFSGQNYGLSVMFLRRRGVDLDPTTKRLLYLSFVFSAALAILAIHGLKAGLVFAPATIPAAHTPMVIHLPIPGAIPLLAVVSVLYVGSLAAAGWRLRAKTRLRDLGPAFTLVLTQALWFTVPALATIWSSSPRANLAFAAIWVSTAHSAQYLWVTTYYAKRSGSGVSTRRFLGKALLAGSAVTVLPGLIFAPGLLGIRPWDAGLAATTFSIVNLHHFILDGAIWKLRDGRVARALLRRVDDAADAVAAPIVPQRSWVRPLAYGIGALCFLIPAAQIYETSVVIKDAQSRSAIQTAIDHLRWMGRETTLVQLNVGHIFANVGYHEDAIRHYQRSIALFPTYTGWLSLGNQYRAIGRFPEALHAYDAALSIEPHKETALLWRARTLMDLGSAAPIADWRQEATKSLREVLQLEPGNADASVLLARLQAQDGHRDEAIRTLERALQTQNHSSTSSIRQQLEELKRAGRPLAAGTGS